MAESCSAVQSDNFLVRRGACILPWIVSVWLLHSRGLCVVCRGRPRREHSGHSIGAPSSFGWSS